MSRSRQKTPISGITKARSEKRDKRLANRRYRRIINSQIQSGEWFDFPNFKEIVNNFFFDKDGKRWFDWQEYPKIWRK